MLRMPFHLALAGIVLPLSLASWGWAGEADDQLTALLDEAWEYALRENPLFATNSGDHRYNDQLPRVSLADANRRHEASREFLARLEAIDRDGLEPANRVSYDIFARKLRDEVTDFQFQEHLTPITNRSGFHTELPELGKNVPLATTEDFDNYISRLQGVGAYVDGHIELLRAGIRQGVTQPAVIFERYREPLEAQIVDDAEQSVLYEPLKKLPASILDTDHARLRTAAAAAISSSVVPAYRKLLVFMQDEYVPNCRGTIGASGLPSGREYYRHCVRKHTTLEVTPEEVHARGLREVERIRGEMDAIIRQVGFEGDFAAFTEHLRTDPKFYASDEKDLLRHASFALKEIDGRLPELFRVLPRTPYGLKTIPAYIAPQTTSAYYQPPRGQGEQAGLFFLNTYDVGSRPLYALEALALHEAVPGHHLQIALQQEMESLPEFRKYHWITAFGEGWALYAERLGLEVGFYEDPYSDFGRLTMEVWRACRLVVDTGIHYLGWTREQAIGYMTANSAMSLINIRSEVDRYIGWPGQALAYKTGELKIRELRGRAEEALGQGFDVRDFHDVVLGSGCVPLDVLEENVDTWIAEQAKG
jgi:uncharacterized protein (DUF885 family)